MIILAVNGGDRSIGSDEHRTYPEHDASVVLVEDGRWLAAYQEERLNRVKHSCFSPTMSVRACLADTGLSLENIDYIVMPLEETAYEQDEIDQFLADQAADFPHSGRQVVGSVFQREFHIDVTEKLRFCKHHLAHAWSTYWPSGYDESLILTIDGMGEDESGTVFVGRGQKLQLLQTYGNEKSLGEFYRETIRLLGYGWFDEYKVMGLAPYGYPSTFWPAFEKCFRLLPGGDYELAPVSQRHKAFGEAGFLEMVRRDGGEILPSHRDFAAGLQQVIETIVLHILRYYRNLTQQKNLCLAGGVAHNSVLTGKILDSNLFERVFVQPAASDAGAPIGAALEVLGREGLKFERPRFEHLFLGTNIGNSREIEQHLECWRNIISYERLDDVSEEAARLLSKDEVIGWVQGRAEFGPRALGNRSILADPRPASNRLRINEMIKKREAYRPFAPSVLKERLHEFFEVPDTEADLSFMTFVVLVKKEYRKLLAAITHIDGTARVQTVSKSSNYKYWQLLKNFETRTGLPILLNTSFNNNSESIVDNVGDAVACLLTSPLNYLIVGDFVVQKSESFRADSCMWLLHMVPNLSQSCKIVMRKVLDEQDAVKCKFLAERNTPPSFRSRDIMLSKDIFSLLTKVNGKRTFHDLMSEMNMDRPGQVAKLLHDALELWTKRVLVVSPS